jgi:hypothetical protein
LDRKSWFIDFANIAGRKNLHKYFISVIKSILCCRYDGPREEAEVHNALDSLNEALNDESLPREVVDAKRAPVDAGAEKKISQLDCIIDVSKVEPLVDRAWSEEILRNEA